VSTISPLIKSHFKERIHQEQLAGLFGQPHPMSNEDLVPFSWQILLTPLQNVCSRLKKQLQIIQRIKMGKGQPIGDAIEYGRLEVMPF